MHLYPARLCYEPLARQEAHQLEALNTLLQYLSAHSPFYRERLDVGSIALQHLQALSGLPFTTKEDLQQRNWDFLCVPRAAIREYTTTSGTLGKPVTIALSENDLQRLAYNECQSFQIAGGKSGEVYQLALTLDRQFMAGMAYYSGIRQMGATVIRCGPGLPQLQWDTIQRLQTTAMVAVPSSLLSLARWARSNGFDPAKSSVQKAICIGENLRKPDFSLSALGHQLQQEWPLQLYATYASTEMQTAFTECAAGMGGHQQPELCIIEIVDEEGRVLPDGMEGEVVVTTLGIEAMPLLRYKTGDIATLHAIACTCGRHSKRLGPIVGRKAQMIKYRGTTLYPPAIFDLLDEAGLLDAYVVELSSNERGTDDLLIHLHTPNEQEGFAEWLRGVFQARLRVAPSLAFHSAEEVQAMLRPGNARKAIRFIDRRTH